MRAYFGAVTGARLIGTHNERADANTNTSRTYPVADLLLRSARGPAVIELAFDNGGIGSEEVTGVYELEPEDAPSCRHAIASSSRRRLRSVAASRPARRRSVTTAQTRRPAAPRPARTPALRASPSPGLRKARNELRCVKRARGDVTKLLECAR